MLPLLPTPQGWADRMTTRRSGDDPEKSDISSLDRMVADTARLVRRWRAEAPEQWPKAQREFDPAKLRGVLTPWIAAGLDPRLLLYLILGTEWLFRARRAAAEDIQGEIRRLEAQLFDPADPILWPDQEPAFQAMAAILRQRMIGDR
jgi:hypothetical protein